MLYTSNKNMATAKRAVKHPASKNTEIEASITLADEIGVETGVLRAPSDGA
jgi:hypothetical protein